MSTPSTPATVPGSGAAIRLLVPAGLGGLVAGVLIGVLTRLATASDIGGDGWSLSGNGALIVPFALGSGVLAGGWTALALHALGRARWLTLGLAAGVVTALLGFSQLLLIALFGAAAGASVVVTMGLALLVMVGAPVAAVVAARDQQVRPTWHLLAAVMLTVAVLVGLVAVLAVP
jgi:hypothetical protein